MEQTEAIRQRPTPISHRVRLNPDQGRADRREGHAAGLRRPCLENRYENDIWTYSLEDVWEGVQDAYRNLAKDVEAKLASR